MKLEKAQSLYVIFNPELNITKVGISDNVESRKKVLECSCGCELILHYHTTHIFDALKYEAMAHKKLGDKRRIGEWFNVTPEEAAEVVKFVIERAVQDPIVQRYRNGDTITSIALTYGVTRQAIIARLKQFGFRESSTNSKPWKFIIKEEEKAATSGNYTELDKIDALGIKKPLPENTYLDELLPSLPLQRLKRLEANINYNGDWYQISTYIAGEFKYAYTQDILKARAYRESMK